MKKSKKTKALFHVQVPVGNLPPGKARDYTQRIADKFCSELKNRGDFIVTPYKGDGRVEIYRVL